MKLITIDAIDLEASFTASGAGHSLKRIVDRRGKPVLNQAIWEIGIAVYEALQDKEHPSVLENYRTGLQMAEWVADEMIEPLIFEMIDKGILDFSESIDVDMKDCWKGQLIEAKILNFLQIVEKRIGHVSLMPSEFSNYFNQIMASLILLKIDDAAISEFLDGRGLIENIEDVHTLYRHLSTPPYVEAIKRHTLQDRAQSGAAASNAKHEHHRTAVFKWLDENYTAGSKHADMATEIEKLVPREYDTILKDITAWKKTRKR